MALINCPECKRKVSDKAESCPRCGYPIIKYSKNIQEESKVKNQKVDKQEKKQNSLKKHKNQKFYEIILRRKRFPKCVTFSEKLYAENKEEAKESFLERVTLSPSKAPEYEVSIREIHKNSTKKKRKKSLMYNKSKNLNEIKNNLYNYYMIFTIIFFVSIAYNLIVASIPKYDPNSITPLKTLIQFALIFSSYKLTYILYKKQYGAIILALLMLGEGLFSIALRIYVLVDAKKRLSEEEL
ncbi:MAG: hypothetical protein ACOC56_00790 [Atribacterota bacterium]